MVKKKRSLVDSIFHFDLPGAKKRMEEGRCVLCGKNNIVGYKYCKSHAELIKKAMQRKYNRDYYHRHKKLKNPRPYTFTCQNPFCGKTQTITLGKWQKPTRKYCDALCRSQANFIKWIEKHGHEILYMDDKVVAWRHKNGQIRISAYLT